MKLIEVALKQVRPNYPTDKPITSGTIPKRMDLLGVGQEATVFQNKKPSAQGTIIKIINSSSESCDHNGTIQYLIQGNNCNNPLVPNVYSIKQIEHKYNYSFSIQMEKLNHISDHDVTDSLLCEALLNSILEPSDNNSQIQFNNVDDFAEFVGDVLSGTSTTINLFNQPRTINKYAQQLSKLLINLNASTNYQLDIHEGNMMVRRTSVGAQLVITDPMWGGSLSS